VNDAELAELVPEGAGSKELDWVAFVSDKVPLLPRSLVKARAAVMEGETEAEAAAVQFG
jgi:hypothetical protein